MVKPREVQGHGRVGLDDGVEHHAPVAVAPGHGQDVLGEGAADAAAAVGGVDHEAGVGDSGGGAAVVGGDVGGGDEGSRVVLDDVDVLGRIHPQRTGGVLRGVRIPCVGLAGGDDPVPERPNPRPVVGRGFSDQHGRESRTPMPSAIAKVLRSVHAGQDVGLGEVVLVARETDGGGARPHVETADVSGPSARTLRAILGALFAIRLLRCHRALLMCRAHPRDVPVQPTVRCWTSARVWVEIGFGRGGAGNSGESRP